MWFSFGRSEGLPSQYAANRTAVTVDVLLAGFIYAFAILAFCFLIALPSIRLKNNAFLFIRISISLLIGLFILLANFGQEWEIGNIETKTAYKAGSADEIEAAIGVKIGLRSVNVTLKSDTKNHSSLSNSTIDYNERFEWMWDQGRFGFGPYAGLLQQQFRAAQYKGLPLPILWIVDYFVIDGEGFRFGRFYRLAGWYTHIALWTAFPCWLLANILFRSVIRYGAYFLALCGGCLLTGNLIYLLVRNPTDLSIPFEDATLVTHYGFSFWLTFVTGVVSLLLALVILLIESRYDVEISIFFGVDPLTIYDEYHLTSMELELLRKDKGTARHVNDIAMEPMAGPTYGDEQAAPVTQTVFLKRKSTIRLGGVPRIRKARLVVPDDQEALYGNMEIIREHQQELPGTSQ